MPLSKYRVMLEQRSRKTNETYEKMEPINIEFLFLSVEEPYESPKTKRVYYKATAIMNGKQVMVPCTEKAYKVLKDLESQTDCIGLFTVEPSRAAFPDTNRASLVLDSVSV